MREYIQIHNHNFFSLYRRLFLFLKTCDAINAVINQYSAHIFYFCLSICFDERFLSFAKCLQKPNTDEQKGIEGLDEIDRERQNKLRSTEIERESIE